VKVYHISTEKVRVRVRSQNS